MPSNNIELVRNLISQKVLKTSGIIDAFFSVDRKNFVPQNVQVDAYEDIALPLDLPGEDGTTHQTISQPYTIAFMLELLQAHRGHNVLDIGSGSGYTTALLAHLVSPGKVFGVEIIPRLVAFGKKNIASLGIQNATIELAHPELGIPGRIFDRILVSANAPAPPLELLNQLKNGGILVAVVNNALEKIVKHGGHFSRNTFPGFAFVPLVHNILPQAKK